MPPLKTHRGSIRLGAGHSLIMGHGPKASEMKFNEAEARVSIGKFGLWNIATPDTTSYYKNVTAEDLSPKPEDYIRPIFRGLSETVVRRQWDPIDFGHIKGVLKSSIPMIIGQSVFSNHEAFVGNEKGVVANAFYDKGYEADGFSIPAGMNLEFLIDGKIHTKLARELLSDPPMVHSNSVTVNFNWQQSHPKMDYQEFRSKIGTFDDKGDQIRRIVTEILAYHETSLVAHGADPYAKIIGADGKITNPSDSVNRDSFSDEIKRSPFFSFSYKESFSENTIPNSSNITDDEENLETTKEQKMPKELILLLASLAGISLTAEQTAYSTEDFATKFDFEAFNTQLQEKKSTLESFSTLAADKTRLEGEVQTLTAEKTELEKFKTDNEPKVKDLGEVETFKAEKLKEVKRLASLATPGHKLEATYDAANLSTLIAFETTLSAQVEDKFPLSCKSCGGTEINRASCSADDDDEDKDKPGKRSYADVIENSKSPKSDLAFLYPED